MSTLLALAAATVFGTAAACEPGAGGTAALVTVHGFKDREGQLRIVIYPANDADFLAGGRYVQRIDVPLTPAGDMTVCAPVPAAGELIVVALHDRDRNGKFSAFRDGVGFSRNPKLGLSKPKIAAVAVQLDGVTPMRIELNYLQGLTVAPVRARQTR
ncbi:MAG: hypothetical protein DI568_02725 [Sphingomonas sp.]|nr:MAG: hypothetical protein DI568_02725 [Sphingomonas sp.]